MNLAELVEKLTPPNTEHETAASAKKRARAQQLLDDADEVDDLARREARIPEVRAARDLYINGLQRRIDALSADTAERTRLQSDIDHVTATINAHESTLDAQRVELRSAISAGADNIAELQGVASATNMLVMSLVVTRSDICRELDRVVPLDEDETVEQLQTTIDGMLDVSDIDAVNCVEDAEDDAQAFYDAEQLRFMQAGWAAHGLPPTDEEVRQHIAQEQRRIDEAIQAQPRYIDPGY